MTWSWLCNMAYESGVVPSGGFPWGMFNDVIIVRLFAGIGIGSMNQKY